MRKVFFTENKGVTSTSATAIANYAAEKAESLNKALINACFYNEHRDLVGTNSGPKCVKKGYSEEMAKELFGIAMTIAQLHKLNAWLREAVKNKEELLTKIRNYRIYDYRECEGIQTPKAPESVRDYSREDWCTLKEIEMPVRPRRKGDAEYCKDHGIELPVEPELTQLTEEDILNEFSIKEYAEYIGTNSASAVFGKACHPDGGLNRAKNELDQILTEPAKVSEMLIQTFTPTVDKQIVSEIFRKFQAQQRAYNAEYNTLKAKVKNILQERNEKLAHEYDAAYAEFSKNLHDIKQANQEEYRQNLMTYNKAIKEIDDDIESDFLARTDEYNKAYAEFTAEVAKQNADFAIWKDAKLKTAANLKIVIPDSCQEIFTALQQELSNK